MRACIKANVERQQPRVVAEQCHPKGGNARQQDRRFPAGQPGNRVWCSGATEPPSASQPDDHRKHSQTHPYRPDNGQGDESVPSPPAMGLPRPGILGVVARAARRQAEPANDVSQLWSLRKVKPVGRQHQPECRRPIVVEDPGFNRVGAGVQIGRHIRASKNPSSCRLCPVSTGRPLIFN